MLLLADLHNAIFLKNRSMQFIKEKWDNVVETKDYEKIGLENPKLSSEICRLKVI